VTPSQLEGPDFETKLLELLHKISCEPQRAFLNLDFGQNVPKSNEVEGFAQLLAEHINDLPFLYDWHGIAVSLTAFPEKNKLKAGQCQSFERTDWLVYRRLLAIQRDRSRVPMFSDYAVDPAPYAKPVRAAPSAHLRYTSEDNYIIVKGTTTKKPYGYGAIFPVAETLVKRNEFMGDTFSEGDMFIRQLANKSAGTGNAPKWRWASTDHHLNVVANGMGALLGTKPSVREKAGEFGIQEALF
jgi:hypothetical protein